MAGKDLNKELNELIQSCKNEGILGDYFDQVIEMEVENDPKYVSNLIKDYIDEAANDIAKITPILSESEVNYAEVKYLADKVKGANLYIGSKGVHTASVELVAAANAKNKAECLENLEVLNSEYLILKGKLTQIAELKIQIENAVYDKKNPKMIRRSEL